MKITNLIIPIIIVCISSSCSSIKEPRGEKFSGGSVFIHYNELKFPDQNERKEFLSELNKYLSDNGYTSVPTSDNKVIAEYRLKHSKEYLKFIARSTSAFNVGLHYNYKMQMLGSGRKNPSVNGKLFLTHLEGVKILVSKYREKPNFVSGSIIAHSKRSNFDTQSEADGFMSGLDTLLKDLGYSKKEWKHAWLTVYALKEGNEYCKISVRLKPKLNLGIAYQMDTKGESLSFQSKNKKTYLDHLNRVSEFVLNSIGNNLVP